MASLAGISAEYYVKLEQGQEAHPTGQVLDALSKALKLDATARSYLHSLARFTTPDARPVTAAAVQTAEWLINSWTMTAAMILDRHSDIVSVNPLMTSLVSGYRAGENALRVLLVDPALRHLYIEWDGLSMRSIGLLRSAIGPEPHHPRASELVAQLTQESARFRELWHRHDIAGMTEGAHPMNHPIAGELALYFAHFPLSGADGHSIFLYYAEPDSSTERALAALAAGW